MSDGVYGVGEGQVCEGWVVNGLSADDLWVFPDWERGNRHRGRQQQPSGLREPRVSANRVTEVVEYLAGQVTLLHQHNLPGPNSGQVHGDARAVDAAPDDDYVR